MNSLPKKIVAINGSASVNSSNLWLLEHIARVAPSRYEVQIFNALKELPHFDPELSIHNPPEVILNFRNLISQADGILICTPEYVFSIPSGLKNALEWCVAATVFSGKPVGLITASASGKKAQEELVLIMETLSTRITSEATWLLSGVKGRLNEQGDFLNRKDDFELAAFLSAFFTLVENSQAQGISSN